MSSALLQHIRLLLGIFVLGLVESSWTAIPLRWKAGLLER